MKKIIVIGLGNFGFNLAKKLKENGCEVLGIDISRDLVENIKDFISQPVIADATNKELLASLMLRDFDAAVISIGQNIASSTLIALHLQEIGVKNIIVRAISVDHGKILNKLGVSEVIFPETEIAHRLANRLSLKNALDFIPLTEEHSIIEIIPPSSFIGKSLKELAISATFQCQVVALKEVDDKAIKIPPSANDIINEKTIMVIIGKTSNIEKIQMLK